MPPKPAIRAAGRDRTLQQKSYAQTIMDEVTNPENRTVVTSVAFFAASVAFLSSSWSELLLPPL